MPGTSEGAGEKRRKQRGREWGDEEKERKSKEMEGELRERGKDERKRKNNRRREERGETIPESWLRRTLQTANPLMEG